MDYGEETVIEGMQFFIWAKLNKFRFRHFGSMNYGGDKWNWYILKKDNQEVHVKVKDTSKGFIIKRKYPKL